jgi:hypothetical protein
MCGNCYPEGIMVCPACKRDDEAFKLGEAESPFIHIGDGHYRCLCGEIFTEEGQGTHKTTAGQGRD